MEIQEIQPHRSDESEAVSKVGLFYYQTRQRTEILIDGSYNACAPFGFFHGDRVDTSKGNAYGETNEKKKSLLLYFLKFQYFLLLSLGSTRWISVGSP
jgi:hypothetical protein